MTEMTPEVAAILRAPFPKEQIGKLPRITCPKCRDSRSKNCDEHRKSQCKECANYITSKHIHLDYIGHAPTTDRLLQADPSWTWEPMAFDQAGLPALDPNGGLWIRLTVAGVTRIGYGDAQGKKGPDAVKEAIGDALRNASMRFGVALDLWSKTPLEDHTEAAPTAVESGSNGHQEAHLVAKAKLRKACQESGWDMHKVADLFAGQHQAELGETTNAELITEFTKSLYAMSDADLKVTAKATAS